jgi:hypothetical protein
MISQEHKDQQEMKIDMDGYEERKARHDVL